MKRYFSLCFVLFMSGLLVGCKSEQQKAFELVKDSNDLNALRSFAATYGDSMEDKVRVLYDTTYTRLLKDSTLFASIENAQSILDRYIAEKNYIAILPNGIHIDEVNVLLSEDKSKADEISEKIVSLQKAFKQYKFVETVFLGWDAGISDFDELDEFEFIGPDQSGKGTINIKTDPIKGRKYIVHRNCTGSYYLNDDQKLVVTIVDNPTIEEDKEEFASYLNGWRNMGANESFIERLISSHKDDLDFMKRTYPPVTRKMVLVFEDDPDGFPSLSGIDSNRADCFFNTVLK